MFVKSDQIFNATLLLLWTDHPNVVVTEPHLRCNYRYNSARNPVTEQVVQLSPPQGDDELKGPFQSSYRSFGKIKEGRWSAFPKRRKEATVQETKLVVPPFLESEIDDSMTVNGLAPATRRLPVAEITATPVLQRGF